MSDREAVARCADCMYCHELPAQLPLAPVLVDLSAGAGSPILQCRRLPKQMTLASGIDAVSGQAGLIAGAAFPPALPDEWCGEFEPIESEVGLKSA